jgi:hypothetical protein
MAKTATSVAQLYQGSWMPDDVLGALPQLKRDYLRETDPAREAMRVHQQKPEKERKQHSVQHEAQRRAQTKQAHQTDTSTESGEQDQGEQSEGRGSSMVGNEQPKPVLRPPEHIARKADQSAFKSAWLAEQRDAAFAAADQSRSQNLQEQEYTPNSRPQHSEPQR